MLSPFSEMSDTQKEEYSSLSQNYNKYDFANIPKNSTSGTSHSEFEHNDVKKWFVLENIRLRNKIQKMKSKHEKRQKIASIKYQLLKNKQKEFPNDNIYQKIDKVLGKRLNEKKLKNSYIQTNITFLNPFFVSWDTYFENCDVNKFSSDGEIDILKKKRVKQNIRETNINRSISINPFKVPIHNVDKNNIIYNLYTDDNIIFIKETTEYFDKKEKYNNNKNENNIEKPKQIIKKNKIKSQISALSTINPYDNKKKESSVNSNSSEDIWFECRTPPLTEFKWLDDNFIYLHSPNNAPNNEQNNVIIIQENNYMEQDKYIFCNKKNKLNNSCNDSNINTYMLYKNEDEFIAKPYDEYSVEFGGNTNVYVDINGEKNKNCESPQFKDIYITLNDNNGKKYEQDKYFDIQNCDNMFNNANMLSNYPYEQKNKIKNMHYQMIRDSFHYLENNFFNAMNKIFVKDKFFQELKIECCDKKDNVYCKEKNNDIEKINKNKRKMDKNQNFKDNKLRENITNLTKTGKNCYMVDTDILKKEQINNNENWGLTNVTLNCVKKTPEIENNTNINPYKTQFTKKKKKKKINNQKAHNT
ncbi:conserved Plasmodium protein, unknown function [Plasmodium yoelii]|uniref:Uncharacterized protein n=3 Tax=Plasmodium yoelii TaxID=5861 RepID=A0AAE9WSD8_PLAYO|nr:conserved Plasmodium protein, unknown function [Plasmodium yoelii]EAA21733.1 hypothetical protein [Plasmodium yoelii yoelii]WBY55598.1 hypothetical protein Py17XNL_000504446 [Plasmodium yoelii yoelii]CDU16679.1 conserved Plasmodium protein, unknown function [Plasmodium yoelii]VTZ74184.1 conserved Plasmodium protein, unknown function [Plasmodium yoelii]|eukprot:XP_730168.1 conserved Plasmodium protein, unknown function [Plasmodium yoelii]